MSGLFGGGGDTSKIDARNKEIDIKKKEKEAENKRSSDRVAKRGFRKNVGRRSLITTSQEGLPESLG